MTHKTKFCTYRALVRPILLYEAGSWMITPSTKHKLDAFANECIRTILALTWYDKMSKEELREKSRQ